MTSNKGNTPPAPLNQPNVVSEPELKDKYPLSIAFLNLHPDLGTGRITQPQFQTLHSLCGPETLKQETAEYVGALHLCDLPDGEYQVIFDQFDIEEEPFE